ncbi:gfo/Idh/MocA family oxidoreductase [Aestuariibacter sp. AA17]|uniref:Gfo/Idh/MocA family oxidoreductase n=1 Tax=Fluctibacter corallii TaxID=2984329 RepID=A0ABT3A9T6_9ALTE|nr:gfo/Idh/MocA family oxidoreductase [Aestuariibacter sp. AA17]MCV2885447.1 gfo/Idh/MocA family oxidoreductase [Aestuariibacter sp. AA17]
MAVAYAKVLQSMHIPFDCLTRSEASASYFYKETNIKPYIEPLESRVEAKGGYEKAIVAVTIDSLKSVALSLLHCNVKSILLEKPGASDYAGVLEIAKLADIKRADVYVAYNRRFYQSVIEAKRRLARDGDIHSVTFEITEWSHLIDETMFSKEVLENWFYSNTSHVADLAFYLGGKPKTLNCEVSGCLPWHSRGSVFSGSGAMESNALFSYHGDWSGPGRWAVSVSSASVKYIFAPLEKLQIQKAGSISIDEVKLNGSLDIDFKPGIYLQTQTFLSGDCEEMCSIHEQVENMKYYARMAGYV